ncbi:MAG: IS607 family transposase [Thermodesulfobacteriota bacterium]|nr:MAG: IS607 family transposase [Thermodesulfobacteriota bacterium]
MEERPRVAIYTRIATKKHVHYLEKQKEKLYRYCQKRGYEVALEVAEIASGINEKRKGLQRLMNAAKRGEFEKIVVESEDRLARFGVGYLYAYFTKCGVNIEIPNRTKNWEQTEELIDDLVSMVRFLTNKMCKLKKEETHG